MVTAARLRPDAVAGRARRRFVDGRRAILDGQLTQLRTSGDLSPDTLLERRFTVIAELERAADATTLRFEGKEVRFPTQADEAVAAIAASRAPFTAAELPGRWTMPDGSCSSRASSAKRLRSPVRPVMSGASGP